VTSRHRDAAWELITDCYNPTLILIQRRGKSCARFFQTVSAQTNRRAQKGAAIFPLQY